MELADHLADNLRLIRRRRNLTQAQLAKLAGIPRSTIAHIEAGGANPTLSVLSALSGALQLSIEELLSPARPRCQLYPKGSLPVHERGRDGARGRIIKLLPHKIPGMEIDRIELDPDARIKGVPHRPGTQEYLTCEAGKVTLWTRGERFDLEPGDVLTFPGDQPHSYHNESRETAVAFSVVTLAPPE